MLSEILFDTVEEIERYQRIYPHIYNRVEQDIEEIKTRIRALQSKLNAPPQMGIPEDW